MIVELVNTGSELMLGRVLNTHQQWLCRQLADLGCPVSRQVAVPDTGPDIQGAVREGMSRADLLITTGGLGPTSDDITRDLIAQLLGRKLQEDPSVLRHIARVFELRKRAMPERTRLQALVPDGATVLHNSYGTAPGLAMEVRPNPFREGPGGCWLVMLPGPPRELRPMFISAVIPLINRAFSRSSFVCRTLRVTGLGESAVEERVGPPLEALVKRGMDLGYCARPGQVDVRLSAHGAEAAVIVHEAEGVVRRQLGPVIYGVEDEEIEEVLVRLLTKRKETLALAESCTGGLLGNRITNVPGASAVLLGGVISYSNEVKQKFLGVRAEILARNGAVSELAARQMAEGAKREIGATYAIGVTGIAGPSGGTPEKPVGTVFVSITGPWGTDVERFYNPWDRETFKNVTAQQAFELLRRKILAA
jgi:nicotinamide-nucleotide amidase